MRAAARTPGKARTRCTVANMVRCAASSSSWAKVKSISAEMAPWRSNPGFRPPAMSAPRKNSPALKSRVSESAICAMTSRCRSAKKRLSRPTCAGSPTCCFKSFTKSARDAFRAGPRLKRRVATRQIRKVTVRTVASGRNRTTMEKFIEPKRLPNDPRRRLLLQRLMNKPSAPPARARNIPSQSSCLTIRQRLAPSASRRAISLERFAPRANSMLARLRQAMSRTAAAIASKSVPIRPIGPSSDGVVLILKRDGALDLHFPRAGRVGRLDRGQPFGEGRQARFRCLDR